MIDGRIFRYLTFFFDLDGFIVFSIFSVNVTSPLSLISIGAANVILQKRINISILVEEENVKSDH